MEVDFLLVLLCHKRTEKQGFPNAAAVWVDPLWSGIWQDQPNNARDGDFENCAFRVRGIIKPLPSTSWAASVSVGICDSIKVHFFDVKPSKEGGETTRDFLYSTGFPLALTTSEPATAKGPLLGVFNYNVNEGISSKRIPNVRVLVHNNKRTRKVPRILRLKSPDVEHHRRTLELGDWVDVTFCDMWPHLKTCMSNPRTYFRDYCSTFFFFDICKLFDKGGRVNLPPWLACYVLANALVVNGVSPTSFAAPENIQLLMRVVKCALTPWTMCAREGLYWDDTCEGVPVEDQPFPLSFVPTDARVFGKDDCEGRASQAQEMVDLFVHIFAYMEEHTEARAMLWLKQSPMCQQKLPVRPATLLALLRGCHRIGQLLHSGVLQAQTVVGDANAFAIANPSAPCTPENAQIIGHSFGIMLYESGDQREYMMIENTGWQRRLLEGERKFTPTEIGFMKHVYQQKLRQNQKKKKESIKMAGGIIKSMENRIYQTIYMGHDKLFFTQDGDGGLRYGISLDTINKTHVRPYDHHNHKEGAVWMPMQEVLKKLSATHHHRIWPAREGAEKMLELYQRIEADLPDFRRTLMTPQKTEAEFERLMLDWGPIGDEAFVVEAGMGGMWLTIDQREWPQYDQLMRETQEEFSDITFAAHPFMHSMMVRVLSSSP